MVTCCLCAGVMVRQVVWVFGSVGASKGCVRLRARAVVTDVESC